MTIDRDFLRQLQQQSLTTAEILYRFPDHPSLLQTFVWQCQDEWPQFPRLSEFLDYWVENIDGKLHKVTVAHRSLIGPTEMRLISGSFRIQ